MSDPDPSRPRFVPERPLPPYTFVPGRSPHPVSDPRGHMHGRPAEAPGPLDPARWWESRAYLYGIDLFNSGYFWEAHEVWEGLWRAAGCRGVTADFLKGLIKLAATGVKHLEGKAQGVRSHARRAAELWRAVSTTLGEGPATFLGLNLRELIERAERVGREGWGAGPMLLVPATPSVGPTGEARR
jgi:hypothetical protein